MPVRLKVAVYNLGLLSYQSAFLAQVELHRQVVAEELSAGMILVEHPPVITIGRNSGTGSLIASQGRLTSCGIDLVQTDRGGDMTAHNPGQLVVYPIINQKSQSMTPRTYVSGLEEVVIALLKTYGIQATRDDRNSGVFLGNDKICAIGVRIKNRVSMHGLALNVCNDLSIFSEIVPCGVASAGVCKVETLKPGITVASVVGALMEQVAQKFPWDLEFHDPSELQSLC